MSPKPASPIQLLQAGGTALAAAVVGAFLWLTPLGDRWERLSYDLLFRFGAKEPSSDVVLVLMDNESYDYFHQSRGLPWDRSIHARLLNRLADDGCAMVVMDCFFRDRRDASADDALAAAIRRQRRVALMAEQTRIQHPQIESAHILRPVEPFIGASRNTCGVAWLSPDADLIVRKHWPFPSTTVVSSLPETAAHAMGTSTRNDEKRWLNYYKQDGLKKLSYRAAFDEPAGYFRNRIVFIGSQPQTTIPDGERDEFCTPWTAATGETVGGVEILATEFMNLVDHDWLRRGSLSLEVVAVVAFAVLLGAGALLPSGKAISGMVIAAAGVTVTAALAFYFGNHWFPWLILVGAQTPCAMSVRLLMSLNERVSRPRQSIASTVKRVDYLTPKAEGYKLVTPAFASGAYGNVWLAQARSGEWRALKAIFASHFHGNLDPYEREFKGIQRYQPVSDKHPGLLRVYEVSQKQSDHFFYVMELGDSVVPQWKRSPSAYKPRDLANERALTQGRRLPFEVCIRVGLRVSDALAFLHSHGLTHRDIKPQNVIFVNGEPKLADPGLVAEIRPAEETRTNLGTPGYMPPAPEVPGTPQADVYALGIMLYVLSTGRSAALFPEIATTLVETEDDEDFFALNDVIMNACQRDISRRYSSALEVHRALQRIEASRQEKGG